MKKTQNCNNNYLLRVFPYIIRKQIFKFIFLSICIMSHTPHIRIHQICSTLNRFFFPLIFVFQLFILFYSFMYSIYRKKKCTKKSDYCFDLNLKTVFIYFLKFFHIIYNIKNINNKYRCFNIIKCINQIKLMSHGIH